MYQTYILAIIESLIVFTLFGAAAYIIEHFTPKQAKKRQSQQENISDIFFAMLGIILVPAFSLINTGLISAAFSAISPEQIFDQTIQSLPYALQILLALVLLDIITYARHRFTHIYVWPVHTIHHSVEAVTWTTKYRLHPFDLFIASLFHVAIMYFLGFGGEAIIYAAAIYYAVDVLNHLNVDFEFKGRMRYVLSCPNYHKWHHATDKDALNKNFVVLFPWIDKLFGTYHFPGGVPESMGVLNAKGLRELEPNIGKELLYPLKKYLK